MGPSAASWLPRILPHRSLWWDAGATELGPYLYETNRCRGTRPCHHALWARPLALYVTTYLPTGFPVHHPNEQRARPDKWPLSAAFGMTPMRTSHRHPIPGRPPFSSDPRVAPWGLQSPHTVPETHTTGLPTYCKYTVPATRLPLTPATSFPKSFSALSFREKRTTGFTVYMYF